MLSYWMDFNDPLRTFDSLRRRMDQALREYADSEGRGQNLAFPRAALRDNKDAFVLVAEVPGLADAELQLSATQDSLTVSGERKATAPKGYAVHRRERGDLRFSRSFALPARIDVDKVNAELKNGLLVVTMPKHPESQPKQITVKAA
ncbi:Hsp20/alpha crystallin family protein [Nannocystis pusilla]|uniref:Hsp20/alpha crystallin family protein n=1 Tax=Nannocystis pusilla TaxID=889268 RepID=UPI003DA4619D